MFKKIVKGYNQHQIKTRIWFLFLVSTSNGNPDFCLELLHLIHFSDGSDSQNWDRMAAAIKQLPGVVRGKSINKDRIFSSIGAVEKKRI